MSRPVPHSSSLRGPFLFLLVSLLLTGCASSLCGVSDGPSSPLPDPLRLADGTPVRSDSVWQHQRRPELRAAFRTHVYGSLPPAPPQERVVVHAVDRAARDGRATRMQVTVHFSDASDGPRMDALLYVPNDRPGPVPAFVGLNFAGNHTVAPDSALRLPRGWVPNRPDVPSHNHRPTPEGRGALSHRWPVDSLLAHGYALITAYAGDFFPDHPDGLQNSVYQLSKPSSSSSGGAISAWAWGLHRLRHLATRTPAIDSSRVIVMGHSRLAKAALWASATDSRFAAVVDNASGLGGSALFRRRCGQQLSGMDNAQPHWLPDPVGRYHDRPSALPVDQHALLALSAPRPLLINAMTKDRSADPVGMFLGAKHASPVWRLLGTEGLATDTLPPPGRPVLSRVGFRLRQGEHSIGPSDWSTFLRFADRHVKQTEDAVARR